MNINHFGLYEMSDKSMILFYALEGNFASTAWRKSQEAFDACLGEKFNALTADDGEEYNLNRRKLSRLVCEEQLSELMKQAHPAFQVAVRCYEECVERSTAEYIDGMEFLAILPRLMEQSTRSVDEWVEVYKHRYC